MMMDIFSNFDPMWFTLCYKNFIAMILPPIIIFSKLWYKQNKITMLLVMPSISYIIIQLINSKLKIMKSFLHMTSMMFMFILFMNITGMLPYLFSTTSHILFTMSIGLPMWMLSVMSSSLFNMKKSIAHLLPDGSPLWLSPFLVMVELISVMIRPLTLSFRLAANMTAGHIIMNLMLLFSASYKTSMFMLMVLLSMNYLMFELIICMIQAYIFCLLISLYTNDHS